MHHASVNFGRWILEPTLDSPKSCFDQRFKEFRQQYQEMPRDHEQRIDDRIESLCIRQETGRKQCDEGLDDSDSTTGVDAATHDEGLGSRSILRHKAVYGLDLHVQVEGDAGVVAARRGEPQERATKTQYGGTRDWV